MSDLLPIPLYVRLRFRNTTGAIVNTMNPDGSTLGTFMYFSNDEIKGRIVIANRGQSTVFKSMNGNVAYAPNVQPARVDFTINTYEPQTFWKLDKINQYISLGYRFEFAILEGNYNYTNIGNTIEQAQLTWLRAVWEYRDGEATHRAIHRGHGLAWQRETNVSVYEAQILTIPALPTAGDQQDDNDTIITTL